LFSYLALTNRVSFSPCSSQFLHDIVRPTCLVPCLIVNSGMTKGSNFGILYFGSPLTKRSITGAPLRTTHSFRFGSSLKQPLPMYGAVTVYKTIKKTHLINTFIIHSSEDVTHPFVVSVLHTYDMENVRSL